MLSLPVAKTVLCEFFQQREKADFACGVALEGVAHKRRPLGIDDLHLAALALVEVADRSAQGIDAFLESSVEPLPRFLAVVADEVCCYDRENVCRETAAAGVEIQGFVRQVDIEAGVDQLAQVGPVAQVACAAVDLVNYDAVSFALAERREHGAEGRPAARRCGDVVFVPADDREAVLVGIGLDRRALFLERHALFRLPGGGYTNVSEEA